MYLCESEIKKNNKNTMFSPQKIFSLKMGLGEDTIEKLQ